jgi:beta-glucosidase-like glycosyl hydrolase
MLLMTLIETFGEDFVLVSHMGVAYIKGLSKNGVTDGNDAVVAVPKVNPNTFTILFT